MDVTPRFFVDSLTGYGESYRKPTITWYVFDRAFNCTVIATYHQVYGYSRERAMEVAEERARDRARQLNDWYDAWLAAA